MEIHCGNLPYSLNEAKLRLAFEAFGTVESAQIMLDKYSDKSRGFGFVRMPDNSQAQEAIATLNGQELDGRKIRISEARPERKFGTGEQ